MNDSTSYSEFFLTEWLKKSPDSNNHKCIFITDNEDAFTAINACDFHAICINNDFTFKDFQRCVCGTQNAGTSRSEYTFVTSFENMRDSQDFDTILDSEFLKRDSFWKLCHKNSVLSNNLFLSENREQLKTILENFVKQKVGKPKNDVFSKLLMKKCNNGKEQIRQCTRNHEIVMEEDNEISKKILFDTFSNRVFIGGKLPWNESSEKREWKNSDDSGCFSFIQAKYDLNNRNDFHDAIVNVSHRNEFHAVLEVLNSIEWDGHPHVRNLLTNFLGAADTDYNYECMRLWMKEGVARITHPGCKADYALLVVGNQGMKKSSFFNGLALHDEWFTDSLDSLNDSQKAAMLLQGIWICELAELEVLKKTSSAGAVKRFLTATTDRYRTPYDKRAENHARQCIFCGTANDAAFLTDLTGNRRFLIVEIGVKQPTEDVFDDSFKEEVTQSWGEIWAAYKNGDTSLVLPDKFNVEAKKMQESYLVDDGRAGMIADFLEGRDKVCPLQVWKECLHEIGQMKNTQATEIGNIISNLPGWKKMKSPTRFGEYGSQRGYKKM